MKNKTSGTEFENNGENEDITYSSTIRKKVSVMDFGEYGEIVDIDNSLRGRVAGMGIRVRKTLKMITKQPVKGPVVVVVDESQISLGLDMAEKIKVEVKR
ncbi:FeoA family protein [Methanohalobium evestigatum Z-7303]|uniref:FeoA family protein n=1 Tax=Methanohalobium evestigatum (strain ATCC BAA-1072 / DSM 3721 / NBRC 107634 / OCM 161 / Z-7303) TaxID=644295 RepID=D7E7R8_METEZ|nr:FeoA family protein [Methanohalobium evestigatum]ADI74141.1 FeoA family protein [Methanohalobium evestigatum Z-7303]